jgi:hypothetical protein
MKKLPLLVLYWVLILNSCAPTPIPSSMPLPTATATLYPTATAVEVPTQTSTPEPTPTPKDEKPSTQLLHSSVSLYAKAWELDEQKIIDRLKLVEVNGKD